MKWSFKLARIAGIDVFVHWTFAILILWLVGIHVVQGHSLAIAVRGVGFVLSIFGCAMLQETFFACSKLSVRPCRSCAAINWSA